MKQVNKTLTELPIKKEPKIDDKAREEQENLLFRADALILAKKSKNRAEIIQLYNGTSLNMDNYVRENYIEYYPHFFKSFFQAIAKLHGLNNEVMDHYVKPKCVPDFIIRFIYGRFPAGVLVKIQIQNPFVSFMVRKYKNFQFLTSLADQQLNQYIEEAEQLMDECDTFKDFERIYCKRYNLPIQLDVFDFSPEYN